VSKYTVTRKKEVKVHSFIATLYQNECSPDDLGQEIEITLKGRIMQITTPDYPRVEVEVRG
jgi:hypothetical protein